MVYKFCIFLCKIFVYILFRVRMEGRENIPRGKGFILACNHRTNFDPLLVAVRMPQQIHFMAKAELFQRNAALAWILRRLGAFPVERGKGDTGAIQWAEHLLRVGGVLGMFPEGTRNKDGTPGRPKSGTAMIACQTAADVLPCAVCFGDELGFRSTVTVRYGKMIAFEELGFSSTSMSPRELKEASRLIMDRVTAMLEADNGKNHDR